MKYLLKCGFVCLVVLLAAGCSRPTVPLAFSPERDFLVPAKVPIKLEKVLYEYDPPGSLMGDGCAAIVGVIEQESLDSFVSEHASREIEWRRGPFHIGEISQGSLSICW